MCGLCHILIYEIMYIRKLLNKVLMLYFKCYFIYIKHILIKLIFYKELYYQVNKVDKNSVNNEKQ